MATRSTNKKKTTKKKPAKKKAKKKASKKKPAPKKKATKKKARKKPQHINRPRTAQDDLPAPLDIEIQIWEAYSRLRSRDRVAAELKVSVHRVRTVLDSDGKRLRNMIDEYRELIVAEKEDIERAGMNLLIRLMARYDAMLIDIERAAAEAVTKKQVVGITNILNPEGIPLTVPQAVEFVVCSRGFSQLVDMISKLRKDISDYRAPQVSTATTGDAPDSEDQGDDFAEMDPAQLAEILEQGGAQLPGILGRLRKHVTNTAQPTS